MLAHLAACLPGTSFLRWVRHLPAEESRPAPAGEGRVVRIEQQLLRAESTNAQLRGAQMVLLREVDRRQTVNADGCRTLAEWVAGRLDVGPDTADTLNPPWDRSDVDASWSRRTRTRDEGRGLS
jgi:hypothetical protein